MSEEIRLLQAEIRKDLADIRKAYVAFNEAVTQDLEGDAGIVTAYHIHVIYGLFENLFVRIAGFFSNHLEDKSRWHAQLLRRMTLQVEGIRPAVISEASHHHLNELRRFRHLFRNAYFLEFDPVRLGLVVRDTQQLAQTYEADLNRFLSLLDEMAKDNE